MKFKTVLEYFGKGDVAKPKHFVTAFELNSNKFNYLLGEKGGKIGGGKGKSSNWWLTSKTGNAMYLIGMDVNFSPVKMGEMSSVRIQKLPAINYKEVPVKDVPAKEFAAITKSVAATPSIV